MPRRAQALASTQGVSRLRRTPRKNHRGISSLGRVRALQARGTGIETPMLQHIFFGCALVSPAHIAKSRCSADGRVLSMARALPRYHGTHQLVATLAKRLMRLPRKQKVVSSNLTGGCIHSFFLLVG